jgi:hypothetical protein
MIEQEKGKDCMAQQFQPGQAPSVPADALILAQTHQLGTIVKESKYRPLLWGLWIVVGVVLVGLAILGNVVPLWHWLQIGLIGVGVLGFLMFLVGILLLFSGLRKRGMRIYLCTNGLMRLQDGRAETIRWDQITEVCKTFTVESSTTTSSFETATIQTYNLDRYVLRQADGQEMTLDDPFGDLEEFGKAIEQHVTECLLPVALATYHAGSPIDFGWISVSQKGISAGGSQKTLAWSTLVSVQVSKGELLLESADGDETIYTNGVPNICVFEALVWQIVEDENLNIA